MQQRKINKQQIVFFSYIKLHVSETRFAFISVLISSENCNIRAINNRHGRNEAKANDEPYSRDAEHI